MEKEQFILLFLFFFFSLLQNDEGAPLMCESGGGSVRWEIQGLLSHHSRCSRGHPAIYSSVEPALSWLRNSVPALQTQS